MTRMLKTYDFLFDELGDPRVSDWPLMSGPLGPLCLIAAYSYAVYVALPKYMAARPPYNLKPVIRAYNVLQILTCMILIYGLATSGWTTNFTLGCVRVDYSRNPMAMRMARYMYLTLLLKIFEFVETIFFILRKKNSQVSGLHVYHHISTFIITWMGVKYGPGGMLSFTVMVNCAVHVIMYTYYLLSSFGPKWQRRLAVVKSHLTEIQLVQLVIIAVHSMQSLSPTCEVPLTFAFVLVPTVIVNIILFIRFYIKNYLKTKK